MREFVDTLKRFKSDLEKCGHERNADTFFSLMRSLVSHLGNINDPLTFELFRNSNYFEDYRSFFISQQSLYYHAIELAEALALRKVQREGQSILDIFALEFSKNAYMRIKDILDFTDFSRCGTFIMIGCGPLPATLFCIHENVDVREIIGLDSNQEAVDCAKELIEYLKLSRIQVTKMNGTDFNYHSADVIYVANLVSPKKKILNTILDTAKEDVQIILRDPYGPGILLSESGMEELDSRFHVVGEGIESAYFLSKHFFLKK